MEKLKLEHLAPYLPYGLQGRVDKVTYHQEEHERIGELKIIDLADHNYELSVYGELGYFLCDIHEFKPILRPLSDLTKEIEHNGERFSPIVEIKNLEIYSHFELDGFIKNNFTVGYIESLSYQLINILLEWHFDVFGLIEKGLAIDINTI